MGSLSAGRLSIVNICVAYITKAVPIAIRYTGVRKQFGPPNSEELPVLEYQLVVRIHINFIQDNSLYTLFFFFLLYTFKFNNNILYIKLNKNNLSRCVFKLLITVIYLF